MPGDKEISQAEIDAKMFQVSRKPEPPPAAAGKPSGPSASAKVERDSLPARLSSLENDIAALKKDLQDIMLDLREKYLETENPFNSPKAPGRNPSSNPKTNPPKQ